MTSGNFDLLDPRLITIPEARQRKDLGDLESLRESIRKRGLINPIVITRDNILVAGERRLTCHIDLGIPVPVQYTDELDPLELHILELEENAKRKDLTWQETVAAVVEFHRLKAEQDSDWTMTKTGEELGITKSTVARYLLIDKYKENELVAQADKLSTATNVAQRIHERKQAGVKRDAGELIDAILSPTIANPERGDVESTDANGFSMESEKGAPHPSAPPRAAIEHMDFRNLSLDLCGSPFNLLHCDFPYGVSAGDKSGQSAAKHLGSYEDTRDVYFELLEAFTAAPWIAESAHLIFWFSMEYYNETKQILEDAGWRIWSRPLIWHKSDNAGIIPDPNRGPRYTYETALFGSRGDRKIVRAVANSFSGATTKEFHTSEKPRAMLEHFLRMVVDDTTRLLDPTAGSGNAVRVAYELGAEFALGTERDADFADRAKENLKQSLAG